MARKHIKKITIKQFELLISFDVSFLILPLTDFLNYLNEILHENHLHPDVIKEHISQKKEQNVFQLNSEISKQRYCLKNI